VLNKHRHSIYWLGLGKIIHNLVLCDRSGDNQAVKFAQNTALNCSLTGVRSSTRIQRSARICSVHEVADAFW
jgi:hypothetical protein